MIRAVQRNLRLAILGVATVVALLIFVAEVPALAYGLWKLIRYLV